MRSVPVIATLALCVLAAGCRKTQIVPPRTGSLIGVVVYDSKVVEYVQAAKGFRDRIREGGLDKQGNVVLEQFDGQGDQGKLEAAFRTLVARQADLILTTGTTCTQIALKEVVSIPVVFTAVFDPVSAHIVEDLQRSGNNFTGTTCRIPIAQQLRLLSEVVPALKRVGFVYNAAEANSVAQLNELNQAAEEMGIEVLKSAARPQEDNLGPAARRIADQVQVILAPADTMVSAAPEPIVAAAMARGIPILAALESTVVKGALAGLVVDFYAGGRDAGDIALDILVGGKKPSQIPASVPKRPRLVVNLSAARRSGTLLPPRVLAEADRVIGQ